MQRDSISFFMILVRKLHKWLGLIVGLQVLLWTVSGLVFAWLDHRQVSAEHSVREVEPKQLNLSTPVADPSTWLDGSAAHIYNIQLTSILDNAVWRVESADGVSLHGIDGAPLRLEERLVRELALDRYVGSGELKSISFEDGSALEARGAGAVWRAQFNDHAQTTMYFAAQDGRLVATRNSTWRWFDFFWMLHTMDYRGRDHFNNPLVITVGTGALWLTLSGFLLLFRSFRREDFFLPR
jgi:uncharacterized iron-regulated membrane protein